MRIDDSVLLEEEWFKCPTEAMKKIFKQFDFVFFQLTLPLTAPCTFPNRKV
jgi:hypothetical protein